MAVSELKLSSAPASAPGWWLYGQACLGILAAGLVLAGSLSALVPDGALWGTFARIADSLAPHFLLAGLGGAGLLALTGGRRFALAVGFLGIAGLVFVAALHLRQSRPVTSAPAAAGDLRVLWFNMLYNNTTAPEQLVQALINSDADVLALAEAAPLAGQGARLAEAYPYSLGCQAGSDCAVWVLSRLPFVPGSTEVVDNSRPGRLIRFAVQPGATSETGAPLGPKMNVIAVHLSKPWFYGYVEADRWYLRDRLALLEGPVVVVGDFNAAPWSHPMRALFAETGLTPPRRPVPSWPASAGGGGVPIDQVLVGAGASLSALAPWGADLGSNHRGLLSRIAGPVSDDKP